MTTRSDVAARSFCFGGHETGVGSKGGVCKYPLCLQCFLGCETPLGQTVTFRKSCTGKSARATARANAAVNTLADVAVAVSSVAVVALVVATVFLWFFECLRFIHPSIRAFIHPS